jgi:hypothetical protein
MSPADLGTGLGLFPCGAGSDGTKGRSPATSFGAAGNTDSWGAIDHDRCIRAGAPGPSGSREAFDVRARSGIGIARQFTPEAVALAVESGVLPVSNGRAGAPGK